MGILREAESARGFGHKKARREVSCETAQCSSITSAWRFSPTPMVSRSQASAGESHEAEQHAPVHGLLEPGVVLGCELAAPGRAFDRAFDEGLLVTGNQEGDGHAEDAEVQQAHGPLPLPAVAGQAAAVIGLFNEGRCIKRPGHSPV